jgi:hypothetical protein
MYVTSTEHTAITATPSMLAPYRGEYRQAAGFTRSAAEQGAIFKRQRSRATLPVPRFP